MLRFAIVAVAIVSLASQSFAGPFGLLSRRGGNNYTTQNANNTGSGGTVYNRPIAHAFLGTAQGVANHLASIGRIGHFGGNPYAYEGVGMGSSPQAAISNCCYYNRRPLADSGVCQGSNGMWYACCRYN